MGGGTDSDIARACLDRGLSPHGRGNQGLQHRPGGWAGPIPAWAGEPRLSDGPGGARRAYPRMGGGTFEARTLPAADYGLSPHGRGNHGLNGAAGPGIGPIPAWAGEP